MKGPHAAAAAVSFLASLAKLLFAIPRVGEILQPPFLASLFLFVVIAMVMLSASVVNSLPRPDVYGKKEELGRVRIQVCTIWHVNKKEASSRKTKGKHFSLKS